MERDSPSVVRVAINCISTHTLTWSVTIAENTAEIASVISTHTLTWSVTSSVCRTATISIISTHTLTWSVTRIKNTPSFVPKISTHTLTWSVTTALQAADIASDNFNSHAHVERDVLKTDLSQHLWHFNSHAHVERDCDDH